MGEIADMILDGILDEQTGEFIDDEYSMNGGCGYPRTMNKKKKSKKVKYNRNMDIYNNLPRPNKKQSALLEELELRDLFNKPI